MSQEENKCVLCQWAREDSDDSIECEKLLENISSPEQFSACLHNASPSKQARYVRALLQSALSSQTSKELLLSLSRSGAIEVVEEIQELLDTSKDCTECTGQSSRATVLHLRQLLVDLSRKSEVLPDVLFIDGVDCPDKHAIAGGSYADIYLATFKGQTVALKRFRTFSTTSATEETKKRGAFYREALVWQAMNHPNVQPFIGVDAQSFDPFLCMVSPWQENGSILACLERLERELGLPLVLDIPIGQAAAGLWYLHQNNIIHGDLHAGNVLMDQHFNVRLSDFGLARFGGTSSSSQGSSLGSVRFCAPELLAVDEPQACASFATDMYSFGCLCLQIHTRKPPFPDITSEGAVIARLLHGMRPTRPFESTLARNGFWAYIEHCWSANPTERPASQSLVESLPLQTPAFSADELEAIPHTEWTITATGEDASALDSTYSRSIDPCFIGLVPVDMELIPRLRELGCPEDLVLHIQDHWDTRSFISRWNAFQAFIDDHPEVAESSSDDAKSTASSSSIASSPSPDWESTLQQQECPEHTITSLRRLSKLLIEQLEFEDASKYLRRVVDLLRNPEGDKTDESTSLLADSLHDLGFACYRLNQYAESIEFTTEAVDLLRHLRGKSPWISSAPLAQAIGTLARAYQRQDDLSRAAKYFRESADLYRVLAHRHPDRFGFYFVRILSDFDASLAELDQTQDGVEYMEEAVEYLRVHPREKPSENAYLGVLLASLGSDYKHLGEYEKAVAPLEECVEMFSLLGDESLGDINILLFAPLMDLSTSLEKLGRNEEALGYSEKAVTVLRGVAKNQQEFRPMLASALRNLAVDYMNFERPQDASTVAAEAVELFRDLAQTQTYYYEDVLHSLALLCNSLAGCGRNDEADQLAQELPELRRQVESNPESTCIVA